MRNSLIQVHNSCLPVIQERQRRAVNHLRHPGLDPGSHQLGQSQGIAGQALNDGIEDIGVYVHIPFCQKKCLYCDFPSQAGQEIYFESYKEALISEIDNSPELAASSIDSIFFGGGTPTIIPADYLAEILEHIYRYSVAADAEVTIEANPGSVSPESLKVLFQSRFNRISFGAQAWQDHLLNCLGRIHCQDDILYAYEAAVNAGFTNINLDLMFALPGQTMDDWMETLKSAAGLKPAHISAYSLMIEDDTTFGHLYNEGELHFPSEVEDRRMNQAIVDVLDLYGYHQYEISNYSLEGMECHHNIKYWKRCPYIGLGTCSHSFYDDTRWHNTHCLEKYLSVAGKQNNVNLHEECINISVPEAMSETMFLGLRLNEGIDVQGFYNTFGVSLLEIYGSTIDKMTECGLIRQAKGKLFLTTKGRDVSNYVFINFLC